MGSDKSARGFIELFHRAPTNHSKIQNPLNQALSERTRLMSEKLHDSDG